MVTGKRPSGHASSADVVERAKAPVTPDRSLLLERVPRAIAAVILRAMAPARDDRFQTAGELARALSASVGGAHLVGWRGRVVAAACLLAIGVPLVALWARQGATL